LVVFFVGVRQSRVTHDGLRFLVSELNKTL